MSLLALLSVVVVGTSQATTLGPTTSNETIAEKDKEAEDQATEKHVTDSETMLVFLFLLVLTLLTIWRFKARQYRFLHETGVSMFLGIVAGMILNWLQGDQLEKEAVFDPEIFFYVLLPPIIFHAGYSMNQKHFFRNIGAILTYAFAGTLISCFTTGFMVYIYAKYMSSVPLDLTDCLEFGALTSATDPVTVLAVFHDLNVDHTLYAIVFGESVLNDAVAIVLYETVKRFRPGEGETFTVGSGFYSIWLFLLTFFGSFAIGCLLGMLTSLIIKFTNIQDYKMLETAMLILLSYSAFLFGEAFELSGIVAILFCGITESHYTKKILSKESAQRAAQFFELLNFLAENFVFLYIGITVFAYQFHSYDAGLIAWSMFSLLIARVVHVIPLSWTINKFRSSRTQIQKPIQGMLMFVGLRGAIAFSLAMRNTATAAHRMILSTTLVIVIITVVLFGGTTVAMLQYLKIRVQVGDDDDEPEYRRGTNGERPDDNSLTQWWRSMDNEYLKPVLSNTPDNWGTDSMRAVLTTWSNWWHRIPESYAHDAYGSDVESTDEDDDEMADPQEEAIELGDISAEDGLGGDIGSFATWAAKPSWQ